MTKILKILLILNFLLSLQTIWGQAMNRRGHRIAAPEPPSAEQLADLLEVEFVDTLPPLESFTALEAGIYQISGYEADSLSVIINGAAVATAQLGDHCVFYLDQAGPVDVFGTVQPRRMQRVDATDLSETASSVFALADEKGRAEIEVEGDGVIDLLLANFETIPGVWDVTDPQQVILLGGNVLRTRSGEIGIRLAVPAGRRIFATESTELDFSDLHFDLAPATESAREDSQPETHGAPTIEAIDSEEIGLPDFGITAPAEDPAPASRDMTEVAKTAPAAESQPTAPQVELTPDADQNHIQLNDLMEVTIICYIDYADEEEGEEDDEKEDGESRDVQEADSKE